MGYTVFTWLGFDFTVGVLLIPLFSGAIGMATNWVAVKMMFLPIEWWGPRLPFKLGFGRYKIKLLGWQGVIPSKAAKMGSIAVDTGLSKLGSMSEFFNELEPDLMAAHIVDTARDEIHAIVEDVVRQSYPEMWATAPPQLKSFIHRRVDDRLPAIISEITDQIGGNIDDLIDLKLMVVRHLESDPRLLNKIFLDVGAKEFRIIVWSGLWFGILLGFLTMAAWLLLPQWWTVPLGAGIMGYVTNWLAIKMIFEPLEPKRLGPFTIHGLFLRRQDEVAQAYSDIIAYKIVTLKNVAMQMLYGPDGDRTRRMIADVARPVVDEAIGMAGPMLRAFSSNRFETFRDSVATAAVMPAVETLADEQFSRERAVALHRLLVERMRVLPFRDFAAMLRSAFVQDEWLLILVGGLLGFVAGLIQMVATL